MHFNIELKNLKEEYKRRKDELKGIIKRGLENA